MFDFLFSKYKKLDSQFNTLNADVVTHRVKVINVEKNISDISKALTNLNPNQEAKQSVSGYGILSLPKNAANGQVSAILKGLTVTNLIKNGNFANGFSNWLTPDLVSYSIEGNAAKFLADNRFDALIQVFSKDQIIDGHIYYAFGEIKCDEGASLRFNLQERSSSYKVLGSVSITATGNFQRYSFITPPVSKSAGNYVIWYQVWDNRESGFTPIYIRNMGLIDLTATFGAGNEPTKEQCDQIFTNWFDGTKSTVGACRIKSVGKNLVDIENFKYFVNNPNASIVYEDGIKCWKLKRTYENFRVPIFDRCLPNTQYTLKINAKRLNIPDIFITVYYEDGTSLNHAISSGEFGYSIITTRQGKTVKSINFNASSNGTAYIGIDGFQIEEGDTATEYEPYKESVAYITAKDEEGKIAELRSSLPNGIKDEIRVSEGKLIKRIGEKTNVASGAVINYADMADNGTYYAWNDDGETETGVKGDTLGIDATTLIYQLAEPEIIPIQVSGSLTSHPNGTVFIEPFVADAGIYTDKMSVLHQDLPIKALEKISKVDFETGVETELDPAQAIIAADKLSFTHPDLTSGDIVFFVYEHGAEGTIPETEISYYDSRYVIKGEDDKFYQWEIEAKLVEGVITPSIKLVEV